MFKENCLAFTTIFSCSALMHLSGQILLAELTKSAVSRQREFYPKDKTEMFGVSITAVDSSVYISTWLLLCACAEQVCTANTSMSHYCGTPAISAALLICLSFYTSFATSVHVVITTVSKPQVYKGASLLHSNPYSRFPQVCIQHALAAGQGWHSAGSLLCNWKSVRQCWLIQNN